VEQNKLDPSTFPTYCGTKQIRS